MTQTNSVTLGVSICALGALLYGAQALHSNYGISDYFTTQTAMGGVSRTGSMIASPFKWAWSCIRHPLTSIGNIPHRIHQVATFFWGWTFGLAISKASYVFQTYFSALKTPLFIATVGGGVTFVAHLADTRMVKKPLLAKLIVIPIVTAIASYKLAPRLTTLSPSKLELGGWSLLPSLSIIIIKST